VDLAALDVLVAVIQRDVAELVFLAELGLLRGARATGVSDSPRSSASMCGR
jgi:hypothetical protein